MRTFLRMLPLLSVPVVAIALMRGELTEAAWMTLMAVVKTVGWGVWICGPLSLAVCLAIVSREAVPRILAEVMLGVLMISNLGLMMVALVLPMLSLRDVFFYLPFFEFLALSMVVSLSLMLLWGKRKIAKKWASATLEAR